MYALCGLGKKYLIYGYELRHFVHAHKDLQTMSDLCKEINVEKIPHIHVVSMYDVNVFFVSIENINWMLEF